MKKFHTFAKSKNTNQGVSVFQELTPGVDYFLIPEGEHEIEFVTYNAAWPKPYRALVHYRVPLGRHVTWLYESNDALNWRPHDANPVFDTGDEYCWVNNACWDGSRYVMCYTGPTGQADESLGIAYSIDLINWTDLGYQIRSEIPPVPVDNDRLFSGGMIYENGIYYIIVDEAPTSDYIYNNVIYSSHDLDNWTREGVIYQPSYDGSWDDWGASQGSLFYSEYDKKYVRYYTGRQDLGLGVYNPHRIGIMYSSSILGPYQTYNLNPILEDNYDENLKLIGANFLFFDEPNSRYILYYRKNIPINGDNQWRMKAIIFN